MFKKLKYLLFVGVLLACLMPVVAGAYEINSLFATPVDDPDGYTSPYAGVTVKTFDNDDLLWQFEGNGHVVSGSVASYYAAPYGQGAYDNTFYLSVPYGYYQDGPAPTVTVTGFGTANYLGLWWGSMDAYNTFAFYLDDALVLTFTGADVITQGAAFGDQLASGSNHYVNFRDLPNFNKVTFSSSQFAFEADNIAIGVVPEPATMLLFGLGLLGLAGVRRKIRK